MIANPLTAAIARGFGAVARLRDARAVHTRGPAFAARATVGPLPGVAALSAPRELDAVMRLSRSFGFPDRVPDILGIAIRLCDVHGEGRHHDVLVVSCLPGPVANPVAAPVGSYAWPTYSSLLPLRAGDRLILLGARSRVSSTGATSALDDVRAIARRDALRFELTWAPVGGRWRSFGSVHSVGEALPSERAEALEFDPVVNDGPDLQLTPFLRDLRRRAYRESRAARPLASP